MNSPTLRFLVALAAFAGMTLSSHAAVGFITQKNKSGNWEDGSVWNQGGKFPNDLAQHNAHIGRGGNVTIAEGKSYSVGVLTLANNAFPGDGALTMKPNSSLTSKSGIAIGNHSKSNTAFSAEKGSSIVVNTSAGLRMSLVPDTVSTLNIDGGTLDLKSQKSNFVIANPVNGKTEATLTLNDATVLTGNRTILAIGASQNASQNAIGLVKITGSTVLNSNVAIGGSGGGSGTLELSSSATIKPNSVQRDVPGLQINATGKLIIKQEGDSFNTINLSKAPASFAPGSQLILDGSSYKGGNATLTLITLGANASGQKDLALKAENFPNHKVNLSWSQDGKTLTANISSK